MKKLNINIPFDWLCFFIGVIITLYIGFGSKSMLLAVIGGGFYGISFGYGLKEEVQRLEVITKPAFKLSKDLLHRKH